MDTDISRFFGARSLLDAPATRPFDQDEWITSQNTEAGSGLSILIQ